MDKRPHRCRRGHWLLPGHMLVGSMPCSCGRHTTWECDAVTSPMNRCSPNRAPCLSVVARFEAAEPATLAVCRGYCPLSLAAVSHPSVNGPIARCRQAVCRGLLVPLPGDAFGVRPLRVAAQAARGALRGSRCWAYRSAWWSLPRGLAVQLQTSGQCVIWCARLASSRSDRQNN
jgi:hypothetical protein